MTSWAYIGGFFDGEGSLTKHVNGFRVTIPQTNLHVLQTILLFSRVGQIAKVTKRKSHWKDSWIYYIANQHDVRTFLRRITPHLVLKHNIVKQSLKKLDTIVAHQRKNRMLARYRKRQAKRLRQEGLSYREIGKKLNIDWGYARRIILGRRR